MQATSTDERSTSVEDRIRDFMRRYQQDHHLTQIEYARLLGVTQQSVSLYVSLGRPIGKVMARAIASLHPELHPLIKQWAIGDCDRCEGRAS